jgi:murein DD-endopeptidase MepM/ murein hydrolase activator NlpD
MRIRLFFGVVFVVSVFLVYKLAYAAETKPELHLPFPEGQNLTCTQKNFGTTSHNYSTTKYALDFRAPIGSPILAMASGTVHVFNDPDGWDFDSYGGFGCHVKIDHGDGYYTLYGHMRTFTVSNGHWVGVGERIGTSGGDGNNICDGHTSGAHMHVALHQGDASSEHVVATVPSKIFAATSSTSSAYLMASTNFSDDHSYWSDNSPVNLDGYFTCDSYGCYVCPLPCSSRGGGRGLPDFIVVNNWLEDTNGNEKDNFKTGQAIKPKARFKNVGSDSSHDIQVKFYLSKGEHVDSNKQHIGTENIRDYNMEAGESQTETVVFTAPNTPGTYNIVACADTKNDVAEEHEGNNCSDEAVFTVAIDCESKQGEWSNGCFSYFNSIFRHRHR